MVVVYQIGGWGNFANMSPYIYAENNPVLKNDPTGLLTQAQFDDIVDYLLKSDGGEGDIWYPDENGGGGRYERRLNPDKWMMDYLNTYDGWKYTDFGGGSGSSFSSRVFELGGNTYFGLVEFVDGKATSMVINTLSLLEPGAYKQEGAYQFLEVDENGGNWFTDGKGLGLEYSKALDMALSVSGAQVGVFESGAAIGTLQNLKTISYSTAKTAIKVTKAAGTAGIVLGAGVAIHEIATGKDNTHTWVDIGVTVASGVAIGLAGTVALPAVAIVGLAYGIFSVAGGSEWIDNNWGYRDNVTGKIN